jgi:glycerophosphoryl diester phosphodiesterase
MNPHAFLAIAHRGASSYAPENTLAAFDLARAMGAQHIELDVHETQDQHLVVIHDDTVDRTTTGTGPVAQYTLAALQALDAGAWFGLTFLGERVPTFAAVLARYKGQLHIHTELKGQTASLAQRTADMIRAHDMVAEVTITSFQRSHLQAMRAYAPEFPLGWLVVGEIDETVLATARELGLAQLCPQATVVTAALVQRLHAEGLLVRAWGVGNEALMRQVVDAGADGMTVNFPDKLLAYLA